LRRPGIFSVIIIAVIGPPVCGLRPRRCPRRPAARGSQLPVLVSLMALVVHRPAAAQTTGATTRPAPAPAPGSPFLPEVRQGAIQEPPPRPFAVYKTSWKLDLPILALTAAVWGGAIRAGRNETCAEPECGRFMLGPADRWAVGPGSTRADRASDITRVLAMASPLLLEGISLATPGSDKARGLGADALVFAEAIMLTEGVTLLLKDSVGRRRPWSYAESGGPGDSGLARDDVRSFPSGHSSETFAAVSVGCVTFVRRHRPEVLGAVAACAPGYALASLTAGLRVHAGAHFPSDVLIGAAIGTAIGITVPLLHDDPRSRRARLGLTAVPGGLGVGVSGGL
jgi:membrane-associated phospholipid phosphatase